MKVILKKNVPRVGKQFDIIEVSNGHANNFLFPQGLAEPATPSKIADIEKKKEALKAEEEAQAKALQEKLEKIGGSTVVIKTKADDKGSLYKKLQSADIAKALNEQQSITLEEASIKLDEPITATGEVEIEIEQSDTKAKITLSVEKED